MYGNPAQAVQTSGKSTPDPIVEATGLVKRYGKLVAVAGLDLIIRKGECFGLLGPNGAGKTSVIKMISCVSPPSKGNLSIAGMDAHHNAKAIKSLMGVVTQEDSLDRDLTVRQNLLAYSRYFNLKRDVAHKRVEEILELFQLTEKKNDTIDKLSGGMKRRLMISRALLNQPQILLLDEPTTGLDPHARRLVWDRLKGFKARGITVVLSTHYMDEAYYLCDRLVIMDKGHILTQGTPRELVEKHTGSQVLELRPNLDKRDSLIAALNKRGMPMNSSGDTIYVFPKNGAALPEDLPIDGVDTLVRNTTLEDVFMRLTGRSLAVQED